jgi:uncharacterized protein
VTYGAVTQLWRFPVKSMGGEQVSSVQVTRRGLHADRLWAVRDLERERTVTARRMPALLMCTARYSTEPGPEAGPGRVPEVLITLPDGTTVSSSDPRVHDALTAVAGRPVRLVALPHRRDTSQHRLSLRQMRSTVSSNNIRKELGLTADEPLPDPGRLRLADVLTLARFSTPPGTFADLAPVHVLTQTSLDTLASHTPDSDADVRRFRPNILIQPDDDHQGGYPESGWTGSSLVTPGARLSITMPTVRCVIPSRAQPGLDVDSKISKALMTSDRFLGSYADVTSKGVIRTGDRIDLRAPGTGVLVSLAAIRQRALERVLIRLAKRS